MAHGVVFPQNIKAIPIEETGVGKQKYWYDLLLSDLIVGSNRLHNILRFDDTANQTTSDKYGMELILGGKTDAEDGKTVIIGQENAYATDTKDHYTVPEGRQLILTECIIKNNGSASQYGWTGIYRNGNIYYIAENQSFSGKSSMNLPIHFMLQEGDVIRINGDDSNLRFTFKGKFIDESLIDIFFENANFIGKGIATYFDSSLENLKQAKTIDDIINSKLAMNDICKKPKIMDFLEDNLGIDGFLNSEVSLAKWIASRSGLDITNFNTYVDIYINRDIFFSTEPKKPVYRYSPRDLITEKFYWDEDILSKVIKSEEISKFSVMVNNQLLLSKFTQVGAGHSQSQVDTYYRFYLYGSSSATRNAKYYSKERFDLTDINSITFDFDFQRDSGSIYAYLGVSETNLSESDSEFNVKDFRIYSSTKNNQHAVLDVSSLTGFHYIGICLRDTSSSSAMQGGFYMKNITFNK